ncbi:metallophosphoesterase [Pedobacter insulae]|uniref:Calcineurin-like phosphoesterase n=1 Tax=Pedobacter insulae TaxID=414048 RepID=A0A1I2TPK9_9SPHI|nr:metallophosphoesterase [Pedobacter insulae]SFG66862.1 Calcineurin-like phosphoesterase [Pedobacter insulae]
MIKRLKYLIFTGLILASCSQKARIVLLPDTQTYAEKYPEVLDAQLTWIAKNAKKIDFVLQQGDLTQNNNVKEWGIVKNAFAKIDNKVPYVLAAGNHDMGSGPGLFADVRNTSLFNTYFGEQNLKKYYGGSFEVGKLENAYFLFQTGKVKWLVITLEFGPRNEVLEWAGKIASKYADRLGIVNTHAYMYSDNTRIGVGDNWRPQAYGIGKDQGEKAVNDGEQIWDKLISKNQNIRWVFSGHILNSGVGTLISTNEKSLPVYQMLANYQEGVKGSIKGGNGFLRIVDLDFKEKSAQIRTFSPFLNEYKLDTANNFTLREIKFNTNIK